MPIDPRSVQRFGRPDPIGVDRPCAHCGYNLRGLTPGGVCPECGQPIRIAGPARLSGGTLTDAPMPYLRRIAWGGVLIGMAAGVVSTAALAGAFIARVTGPGPVLGALFVSTGAWVLGVWVVTCERPPTDPPAPPDRRLTRLTIAARLTQLGWPAAILAQVIASRAGAPLADLAGYAGLGMGLIGALGILPTCLVLADLAEWAMDTGLAARFRTAGVGVSVFGTISLTLGFAAPYLGIAWIYLGIVYLVTRVLFLVGVVALIWSAIQLAFMPLWAISNSANAMARDRRAAAALSRRTQATIRRDAEALAADTIPMDSPGAPVPSAGASPAPSAGARRRNIVPRAGDAQPYDLEPE